MLTALIMLLVVGWFSGVAGAVNVTISGYVFNTTNGSIDNISIWAMNITSEDEYNTTANESGYYSINLSSGMYMLQVYQADGMGDGPPFKYPMQYTLLIKGFPENDFINFSSNMEMNMTLYKLNVSAKLNAYMYGYTYMYEDNETIIVNITVKNNDIENLTNWNLSTQLIFDNNTEDGSDDVTIDENSTLINLTVGENKNLTLSLKTNFSLSDRLAVETYFLKSIPVIDTNTSGKLNATLIVVDHADIMQFLNPRIIFVNSYTTRAQNKPNSSLNFGTAREVYLESTVEIDNPFESNKNVTNASILLDTNKPLLEFAGKDHSDAIASIENILISNDTTELNWTLNTIERDEYANIYTKLFNRSDIDYGYNASVDVDKFNFNGIDNQTLTVTINVYNNSDIDDLHVSINKYGWNKPPLFLNANVTSINWSGFHGCSISGDGNADCHVEGPVNGSYTATINISVNASSPSIYRPMVYIGASKRIAEYDVNSTTITNTTFVGNFTVKADNAEWVVRRIIRYESQFHAILTNGTNVINGTVTYNFTTNTTKPMTRIEINDFNTQIWTDENNNYEIYLPNGTYEINAGRDRPDAMQQWAENVIVNATQNATVNFTLQNGSVIAGSVFNESTNESMNETCVIIKNESWSSEEGINEMGYYRIHIPASGNYTLTLCEYDTQDHVISDIGQGNGYVHNFLASPPRPALGFIDYYRIHAPNEPNVTVNFGTEREVYVSSTAYVHNPHDAGGNITNTSVQLKTTTPLQGFREKDEDVISLQNKYISNNMISLNWTLREIGIDEGIDVNAQRLEREEVDFGFNTTVKVDKFNFNGADNQAVNVNVIVYNDSNIDMLEVRIRKGFKNESYIDVNVTDPSGDGHLENTSDYASWHVENPENKSYTFSVNMSINAIGNVKYRPEVEVAAMQEAPCNKVDSNEITNSTLVGNFTIKSNNSKWILCRNNEYNIEFRSIVTNTTGLINGTVNYNFTPDTNIPITSISLCNESLGGCYDVYTNDFRNYIVYVPSGTYDVCAGFDRPDALSGCNGSIPSDSICNLTLQNGSVIAGSVFNASTNESMNDTEVWLWNESSQTWVDSTWTNNYGYYDMHVPAAGNYTLGLRDHASNRLDRWDIGQGNGEVFNMLVVVSCGDAITSDLTLPSDLGPCFGDGLIIGADNITLDCAGHTISGSNTGAGISNLDGYNNITIKNCTIQNYNHGIFLNGSNNDIIINNNVSSNFNGIYLYSSSYNNLTNNNASGNGDTGIRLESSSNYNNLTNNNASGNSHGIWLWYSDDNTLSNNTANLNNEGGICLDYSNDNNITNNNTANENKHCGIQLLWGSSNNTVANNTANSNKNSGICLQDSSNHNNITDNNANNNTNNGINLDNSNNNTITNNTASSNNGTGVGIFSSNYTTLLDNVVTFNSHDGIYVDGSEGNNLTANDALSNEQCGISLNGVSYNNIVSNNVSNNHGGINLHKSYNNTITNNTANLNNEIGINLDNSKNNTITNNNASGNSNGIYLNNANNNTLLNNTASNNTDGGFFIVFSSNNTMNHNEITDNKFGITIHGDSANNAANWNNITNNTEYGVSSDEDFDASFNWWNNSTGPEDGPKGGSGDGVKGEVDYGPWLGFPVGMLPMSFYLDATSNTIKNITETVNEAAAGDSIILTSGTYEENVDIGKRLNLTSKKGDYDEVKINASNADDHVINVTNARVNISGITVTGSKAAGIYLYKAHYTNISKISASGNYDGIYLNQSSYINITNSSIEWNDNTSILIGGGSNNTTITGNTICHNGIGMQGISASNTTIENNTFCVELESPPDGYVTRDTSINFTFRAPNVVEANTNCTLYVDNSMKEYNSSVEDNVTTKLNATLPTSDDYSWLVNCSNKTSNNIWIADARDLKIRSDPCYISGNETGWLINTTNSPQVCINDEVPLTGNLTIEIGGTLELYNVTLKMNSTYSGELSITVSGNLTIDHDGFTPSNITAVNTSNPYSFRVNHGATFRMDNSELHHAGDDGVSGLLIMADNVVMKNNEISDNYIGISFFNSTSSILQENSFAANSKFDLHLNSSLIESHHDTLSSLKIENSSTMEREGDLEVAQPSSVNDSTLRMDGDLTINNSFSLHNITLIMVSFFSGEHGIEALSNANLSINESNITSSNSNEFLFRVRSKASFTMKNSELHECGYEAAGNLDRAGLWINTENAMIDNNTFSNNYGGVVLYQSNHNNIIDNNASYNNLGILLLNVSYTTIANNTANNNTGESWSSGIIVVAGSHNTIRDNTLQNNTIGIFATSSDPSNPIETINNTITNNNASYNTHGMLLMNVSYTTIANNIVNNNTGEPGNGGPTSSGIIVMGSHNAIRNNTLQNNTIGISVSQGDPGHPIETINNTITNNNASYSNYGIYLDGASNNTLTDNTVNSNERGIYLSSSNNTTLESSTFSSNTDGIYASSSTFVVSNSTVSNSGDKDVKLYNGSSATFTNTTFNFSKQLINDTSSLRLRWYLEVCPSPSDATVSITSNNTTDSDAYANIGTNFWAVTQFVNRSTANTTDYNPYSISGSRSGYDSKTVSVSIFSSLTGAPCHSLTLSETPTPPSGGGGDGADATPTPAPITVPVLKVERYTIGAIEAGTQVIVPFTKTDVTRVMIRVRNAVKNVKIEVLKLGYNPPDECANVSEAYGYMQINTENINDADISSAKIKFKVDTDWIDDNKIDPATVQLLRCHAGGWEELATNKVDEDALYDYFDAETPGFSVFSITGELDTAVAPTATATPMATITPVLAPSPTATATPTPAVPPEMNWPLLGGGITVVVVIILLAALVYTGKIELPGVLKSEQKKE